MAVSDPELFVECDRCNERIDFSFAFVLHHPFWMLDERFHGWWIDWAGADGQSLCPKCNREAEEEDNGEGETED